MRRAHISNIGVDSHDDLNDALVYLLQGLAQQGLELPKISWIEMYKLTLIKRLQCSGRIEAHIALWLVLVDEHALSIPTLGIVHPSSPVVCHIQLGAPC